MSFSAARISAALVASLRAFLLSAVAGCAEMGLSLKTLLRQYT